MSCLKRTPLVHEDQRLTHFAALLQKRIADAFCGGGGGGDVIWNNVLFVDQGDPGAIPAIGYWTRKYPTIQSAVNAAVSGDLIFINPGTYIENVDLMNIADKVTIQGSGFNTIIEPLDTNEPTVKLVPAIAREIALTQLSIKDIVITNLGDFPNDIALQLDFTNDPGAFDEGGIFISNVIPIGSCEFSTTNELLVNTFWSPSGRVSFANVSHCRFADCRFEDRVYIEYDFTEAEPSKGRDNLNFEQCDFSGGLNLNGTPLIFMDSECQCGGDAEVGGIFGTLLYDANSNSAPMIEFHGKVTESVRIEYEDANAEASANIGNFDHAEIYCEEFTWIATGANIGLFRVTARNAVFDRTSKNGISADGTGQGGQGNFGIMDLLNATFAQGALDITSYAVDRTLHTVTETLDPVFPNVVNILIQPPYYNPYYTIHPEIQAGVGGLFANVEVANKSTSAFDATSDQPVQVEFRLIQQIE